MANEIAPQTIGFTPAQAAQITGMCKASITRAIRLGILDAIYFSPRSVVVPRAALFKFMRKRDRQLKKCERTAPAQRDPLNSVGQI